ncbi:MAG TPA: MFS transporter [Alphaproteobacteria bacterium]|nr:MFS transporter [Alphaproteobacteria bacterium]
MTCTAPRRELFAWAMYDFANSGYTTVVLTTIFNAYFVGVVAGGAGGFSTGSATLLWTVTLSLANALVLVSAPVLGAIADHDAAKKRLLVVTTVGCVLCTGLLALIGPGDVWPAMALVMLSSLMFATGENLIAAFLPEISPQDSMGRVSAYGWTLGYIGGLSVLGLCLAYVTWAQWQGWKASDYVPGTMLIVAGVFALAATPTFLWLRERAVPAVLSQGESYLQIGFRRLRRTLAEASRFRDLFRFLLTLTVYQCGINTVVVLAAVYAQEVMGFTTQDTITLVMVVNVTAAVGAFLFGRVQDRIGSVPTLALTLVIWSGATGLAFVTESRAGFWLVANLVGVALGSSQSAGRALIGQFTPPARAAEFFGLWGLAGKLAAVVGPFSYGLIAHLTAGNQRLAILSTIFFFAAGLALLATVDESRGKAAAHSPSMPLL